MAIWGEKKAIPALMRASGITKEQAKTCLYYAIATYFLPDELDIMPILVIIGPQGTGKSELLKQIGKFVNKPKLIGARTYPALRDKFGKTTTALLDDADDITEANEKILINRYSKENSLIQHKVNMGGGLWVNKKTDVFGATIITKRMSFKDAATTSRSIIVKTKYCPGDYKITRFRNIQEKLSQIAQTIDLEEIGKPTSHRTENNWMAIRAVATYLKDKEWLEYSEHEMKAGTRILQSGQSYEPEQATLMVFKEKTKLAKFSTGKIFEQAVLIKDIKDDLRAHFDVNLKVIQIEELLHGLGFKVVRPSGYPKVKIDEKLLSKLLRKYK